MKTRSRKLLAGVGLSALGLMAIATSASADTTLIDGGQTSVLLDTAALSAAANLDLSGISEEVIAPGNLGSGSVAFGINGRTGANPTTFAFDSSDFLGSFSGTIEHTGSVFFNDNAVEVGDFRIGFDAGRAGGLDGQASGFFVESLAGINAVLFDVSAPSALEVGSRSLLIDADLLVSNEFAGFLQANSLASTNLAGVDVGDARVQATAVPTPTAAAAGLLLVTALAARRRGEVTETVE
ncbi:MAG: hypothetical protein AAGH99_02840 [Planctomycetota bacterium]